MISTTFYSIMKATCFGVLPSSGQRTKNTVKLTYIKTVHAKRLYYINHIYAKILHSDPSAYKIINFIVFLVRWPEDGSTPKHVAFIIE
jgi:hypothetical protein